MLETVVSSEFNLDFSKYSQFEIDATEKTIDLFSRIRSTAQAEISATALYAYDMLIKAQEDVSDKDILEYVLNWKKQWAGAEEEILTAIVDLAMLKWIRPKAVLTIEDE
ncbi:MAG: hypothetical protein LBB94_03375 [Clostridiales bacterium]|nr:hypothetical protein [Clostridiales bacterium]